MYGNPRTIVPASGKASPAIVFNPSEDSKYFEIYKKFFLNKIKENQIKVIYTVKPLWGGNDVFEKTLGQDCFKKSDVTKILDSYLILDCKNLK